VKLSEGELATGQSRLLLRPFHLDDVPAVTAACQDREISRWTVSIPWPYEERHARSWIETHEWLREEGSAFPFAITDRRSGQLLGSIGIEHAGDPPGAGDVGYWVAASARNRGVATEALEMISAWAFQRLRLDRIHLVTKTGTWPPSASPRRRVTDSSAK
jgi:RimJ/RimL family protein N-acetyltransferase